MRVEENIVWEVMWGRRTGSRKGTWGVGDLAGEESPCHTYVFYTVVHLLVNPIQESTAGHA